MPRTTQTPTLVLCELPDASADGVLSFSPFCLKVHAALARTGSSYTRRPVGRPDALRAVNVTGQAPVLLVDGVPVADSTQILARLDELSGGGLYRRVEGRIDPEDRLWEEFADTAVNGFVVAARWADDRTWPLVRDAYFAGVPSAVRGLVSGMVRTRVGKSLHARDVTRRSLADCWARFFALLDDLDGRAPRDGFWLGERVSAADVALYGQLRSLDTRLTPPQRDALRARPQLVAYLARVGASVGMESAASRAARGDALRSAP